MRTLLEKYATRRNLFILLILVILCNVSLLVYYWDFDEPILDTYIYYSTGEAYKAIENYGEYDRQRYIRGTLMLDFVYPIIYCLMLAFAIFRLNESIRVSIAPLCILPIDYLENVLIIFMISKFPTRYDVAASVAGIMTLTKWTLVAMCLLGILVLFFARIFSKKSKFQ